MNYATDQEMIAICSLLIYSLFLVLKFFSVYSEYNFNILVSTSIEFAT